MRVITMIPLPSGEQTCYPEYLIALEVPVLD